MASNLVQRVGFAVVAIPLALAVVWYGGWPLALLVSVVSVLGVRELVDFAHRQGIRPLAGLAYVTSAAFGPLAWLLVDRADVQQAVGAWWPYAAALWFLVLLTATLVARGVDERPLGTAATTLFAVAYAGALPAFLVAMRHGAHGTMSWAGTWFVFFPLVTIWVCDTAAMFGGRAMGGPKLWPSVSPGKTRSGSAAGVAGGLLVALVFWHVFPLVGVHAHLGPLLAIAGVLSVWGQAGDLVESLFKREVGVKDSSALIPGHGGVLDRFDSLYVALPVAAAMYKLFGIGA